MKESERLLKKMSMGDVLDYAIEAYRRNLKSITLLSLIFLVPFTFVTTAVTGYFSAELMKYANPPGNGIFPFFKLVRFVAAANPGIGDELGKGLGEAVYTTLAFYFVLILIGLLSLAYSVTLKAVMDASVIRIVYFDVVHARSVDWRQAVKLGFSRFASLMTNKILTALIIAGTVAAGYIVFFILILVFTFGMIGPTLGNNAPMGTFAAIFLVQLIIGLVCVILFFIAFFTVKLCLGIHSVVIENRSAVEAVKRSWKLTGGNFWSIALTYLFGSVLFFTVPTILSIAANILIFVNKTLFVAGVIATEVVSSLLYPFILTLLTMVFINLKIKKEGLDLEVKVDKLLERQVKASDEEAGDVKTDFA